MPAERPLSKLYVVTLLSLVVILVGAVEGRSDDDGKRSPLRPSTIGVWGGVSYDSPAGEFWGVTAGRDFHEVALQFGWRLVKRRHFRLEYTIDLIPFAMITANPTYRISNVTFNGVRAIWITGYETKYGVGATPIGIVAGVPVNKTLFLFGSCGAGFLAFEGQVPTLNASYFNFTVGFGGGMEVFVTDGWSVLAGYKFHHISNAGRAYENPGIDSHMYYLGTRWLH